MLSLFLKCPGKQPGEIEIRAYLEGPMKLPWSYDSGKLHITWRLLEHFTLYMVKSFYITVDLEGADQKKKETPVSKLKPSNSTKMLGHLSQMSFEQKVNVTMR